MLRCVKDFIIKISSIQVKWLSLNSKNLQTIIASGTILRSSQPWTNSAMVIYHIIQALTDLPYREDSVLMQGHEVQQIRNEAREKSLVDKCLP
jgi:hypothetical protein